MLRVKFMAEEFLRSFGKSLLKNVLLMAMFSISLVMAVLMCSYYLDMGDRFKSAQHVGDSMWYSLNFIMADYESNRVPDSFTTVTGCRNMMSYYEELSSSEEYPFFSLKDNQSVYLREDDLAGFFRGGSYEGFLDSQELQGLYGCFTEEEQCNMWCFQAAQIDLGAYRMFGFRTVEGQGYTEDNMVIKQASDPIPILLGNDYQGVAEVGSVIDISYCGYAFPCKVAGILERGLSLPPYGKMDTTMTLMDSRIIFPHGIRVQEDPANVDEIEKYAFDAYIAVEDGTVQIPDGREIGELVEYYQKIGERYGIPPAQPAGLSVGMNLFRKESAASVRILLILTVALLCFAFYGLFVMFNDKIQSNSRIYGIYLMNGCSLGMILVPCLLEVAVILLPAICLGRYVFSVEIVGEFPVEVTVRVVYLFTGAAYLVGAAFLAYLMRGVDTEHLIRQKD